MYAKIKKEWVEELRSGRYKQGKYALRNEKDEYCCLGVLCAIYIKAKQLDTNAANELLRFNVVLPQNVREWANLPNFDVTVDLNKSGSDYSKTTLTHLNDNENKSFNEIADIIEKCVPED